MKLILQIQLMMLLLCCPEAKKFILHRHHGSKRKKDIFFGIPVAKNYKKIKPNIRNNIQHFPKFFKSNQQNMPDSNGDIATQIKNLINIPFQVLLTFTKPFLNPHHLIHNPFHLLAS